MAEIESPARVEPVISTEAIDYDVSNTEALIPVAERRRKYNRVKKFAGTMAVASMTALAVVGSAGSESSAGSIESDLTGPQIQLVCAYPKDVATCDIEGVRKIGEDMQDWVGNPQKGAEGYSFRLAMAGGNISVVPVQLDGLTSDINRRASITSANANAPDNLHGYLGGQLRNKIIPYNLTTEYITVLTNTPGLDQNATGCGSGQTWNNINIPGGSNFFGIYLTPDCNQGYSLALYAAQGFFHNEGYLYPCQDGFIESRSDQRGYSSERNNILNYDISNSWAIVSMGSWLRSKPGCPGADVNPRMDWLLNVSKNGAGLIKYYSNSQEIQPDPGSRLQAGSTVEAKYIPAKGETFTGWSGDCTGTTCEFLVDEVIDIRANVKSPLPPPKEKFKLTVKRSGLAKAANLAIKDGLGGIACPTDCAEMLPTGTKEKLVARTRKGFEAYWKKCGGKAVKNVCTLVIGNRDMLAEAAARKR